MKNQFKFSPLSLRLAQSKLKSKPVFKVNKDNYVDYENFILKSLQGDNK